MGFKAAKPNMIPAHVKQKKTAKATWVILRARETSEEATMVVLAYDEASAKLFVHSSCLVVGQMIQAGNRKELNTTLIT